MQREDLKKYKLPDEPGVYVFKKGRRILYIGKAASLRDRVRSYFSHNLADTRSPAVRGMVEQAGRLEWQSTGSVLEALILEANLIKKHQPSFNIEQKDNKSWNHIVITKEDFPRVLLIRGRELFSGSLEERSLKLAAIFGPYPHGGQLKEALKMIRRIFPYRDTCTPCQGDTLTCRPCFNRQLGLCPGVCSGDITKEEYATTIRNIRDMLSGKFKGLKRCLSREMKTAAKNEDFEKAAELRRQISALEHIRDVSLIKEERISAGGPAFSAERAGRIEAFDVAHTGGTETVAVMTVVQNGEPIKAAYRKFKIHSAQNNDIAALTEVLTRRLNHQEWPLPRVFAIDGGKAQLRAAERVLKDAGLRIPVVAIVKNEYHKPKGIIGDRRAIDAHSKDILLANAEAHRFAIGWHKIRLRRKNLS